MLQLTQNRYIHLEPT
jgi:hypothetical protein